MNAADGAASVEDEGIPRLFRDCGNGKWNDPLPRGD
jgi:hypothetical protein